VGTFYGPALAIPGFFGEAKEFALSEAAVEGRLTRPKAGFLGTGDRVSQLESQSSFSPTRLSLQIPRASVERLTEVLRYAA
jgi:hypothetical protein